MLAEVRTTRRLRGGRAVNARAKNLARPSLQRYPAGNQQIWETVTGSRIGEESGDDLRFVRSGR